MIILMKIFISGIADQFKNKLAQRRQVAKELFIERFLLTARSNIQIKEYLEQKAWRLCGLARGIAVPLSGILFVVFVLNPLILTAQNKNAEMASSRYAIQRSSIVGAGGALSSPSFSLQQQFSVSNLGNMQGGQFFVGTAVELKMAQEEELPTRYSMSQNYPNPFNQSTTFIYSLPEKSDITIAIYSMLGREIAVLVRGEQDAGRFQLKYNGLDGLGHPLPSGLYFCRLTSQKGFDKTIKFAILR